ncbi:hypothetical protein HLB15_09925 [Promicromonospora citrea]|uniref:hypothetical protein n=1 Tax=Promicromonospora citrea TaxID=43677 RepID=UPI0014896915|nr:hypothetical protein [Promicromonospora citrea]NNH52571.1 hypothetical protein [Promicromonospora citrea]
MQRCAERRFTGGDFELDASRVWSDCTFEQDGGDVDSVRTFGGTAAARARCEQGSVRAMELCGERIATVMVLSRQDSGHLSVTSGDDYTHVRFLSPSRSGIAGALNANLLVTVLAKGPG